MSADESVEQAPAAAPMTATTRLVQAREALGMSVTDVALATRIPERHLHALERGDFAALPAKTYVSGFARSYARVVGLDEAVIVQAIGEEYRGSAPQPDIDATPAFTPGDPARVPSARFAWLAGAVAVVIAGGAYIYSRSADQGVSGLPSLLPPDAPATPVAARAVAPKPVAAPSGGPVVFTSQDDNVWVKFYDGTGKQLMQKLMAKGETYTVPADALNPMIWTGRPEVLAITVGGQAVPPLADGRQRVKDMPVSAAALLARAAPATGASGAAPGATGAPVASPAASPIPTASGTTGVRVIKPRPYPRSTATGGASAAVAPAAPAMDAAAKPSTDSQ